MDQLRRILIVDDHPVVRRGLRTLLEGERWVGEVLEAATAAQAVKEAVSRRVDVVAMDVALPDGDGIEAAHTILRRHPDARVLVLTLTDDDGAVGRALRAGARGYLLKDTDPDTIVDALRAIAGGCLVIGPRVGADLFSGRQRTVADLPPPFDRLTNREREIVIRLVAGESNAEIAKHLGLNEKTVRNQLSAVFVKLNVADRTQAALLAQKNGITTATPRPRAR